MLFGMLSLYGQEIYTGNQITNIEPEIGTEPFCFGLLTQIVW